MWSCDTLETFVTQSKFGEQFRVNCSTKYGHLNCRIIRETLEFSVKFFYIYRLFLYGSCSSDDRIHSLVILCSQNNFRKYMFLDVWKDTMRPYFLENLSSKTFTIVWRFTDIRIYSHLQMMKISTIFAKLKSEKNF